MITPYPHETDTYLAAVAAQVERNHRAEELADVGVVEAGLLLAENDPEAAARALCRTAKEMLKELTP